MAVVAMTELPSDTTVIYSSHTTTYHKPDDSGGTETVCGAGIVSPIYTEVQYLPWYEQCTTCYSTEPTNSNKQTTLDG